MPRRRDKSGVPLKKNRWGTASAVTHLFNLTKGNEKMTINEVLTKVDKFHPNDIAREDKIDFLSAVERRIINETLSRYPDAEYDRNFVKYHTDYDGDGEDDGDKSLIVPSPYDELYIHYLASQIYLILHEQTHYNNELYVYNSLLADYKVHLNRTLRPGGVKKYKVR